MVIGLGTDIVENERIKTSLSKFGDRFLNRIYDAEEQEYCLKKKNPIPSLAARFAAKEAFIKAMNLGKGEVIPFKDIYVAGLHQGKKTLELKGEAKARINALGVCKILLSISHGRDFSMATVIVEK